MRNVVIRWLYTVGIAYIYDAHRAAAKQFGHGLTAFVAWASAQIKNDWGSILLHWHRLVAAFAKSPVQSGVQMPMAQMSSGPLHMAGPLAASALAGQLVRLLRRAPRDAPVLALHTGGRLLQRNIPVRLVQFVVCAALQEVARRGLFAPVTSFVGERFSQTPKPLHAPYRALRHNTLNDYHQPAPTALPQLHLLTSVLVLGLAGVTWRLSSYRSSRVKQTRDWITDGGRDDHGGDRKQQEYVARQQQQQLAQATEEVEPTEAARPQPVATPLPSYRRSSSSVHLLRTPTFSFIPPPEGSKPKLAIETATVGQFDGGRQPSVPSAWHRPTGLRGDSSWIAAACTDPTEQPDEEEAESTEQPEETASCNGQGGEPHKRALCGPGEAHGEEHGEKAAGARLQPDDGQLLATRLDTVGSSLSSSNVATRLTSSSASSPSTAPTSPQPSVESDAGAMTQEAQVVVTDLGAVAREKKEATPSRTPAPGALESTTSGSSRSPYLSQYKSLMRGIKVMLANASPMSTPEHRGLVMELSESSAALGLGTPPCLARTYEYRGDQELATTGRGRVSSRFSGETSSGENSFDGRRPRSTGMTDRRPSSDFWLSPVIPRALMLSDSFGKGSGGREHESPAAADASAHQSVDMVSASRHDSSSTGTGPEQRGLSSRARGGLRTLAILSSFIIRRRKLTGAALRRSFNMRRSTSSTALSKSTQG